MMKYYFNKTLNEDFDKVIEKVTEELKKRRFWYSDRNRCEGDLEKEIGRRFQKI